MGSSAVEGLFGSFSHYLYKFQRPSYQGAIGKFRQKVHAFGVAHNHLFLVQIPHVKQQSGSAFTDMQYETISLFCHAASLPALNIMTSSYRENEAHYEVPYGISHEPVTLNFYGDSNMMIKSLFDQWYSSITNSRTMPDKIGDNDRRKITGTNRLRFMDDYTADIDIIVLDKSTSAVYKMTLINAWPKSIGGIQLEASNTQIVSFPVQFSYERLEIMRIAEDNEMEGKQNNRIVNPANFPMSLVDKVGAVASELIETATGFNPLAIQVAVNNSPINLNNAVTTVRDQVTSFFEPANK